MFDFDKVALYIWFPLRWTTDKCCQLGWKLFGLGQAQMFLVFTGLCFYFGVRKVGSYIIANESVWAKSLHILLYVLVVTMYMVVLGYLAVTKQYESSIVTGKTLDNPLTSTSKFILGFFWLESMWSVLFNIILKRPMDSPMGMCYELACAVLMTDSDNEKGEPIPTKIKNHILKPAMVTT